MSSRILSGDRVWPRTHMSFTRAVSEIMSSRGVTPMLSRSRPVAYTFMSTRPQMVWEVIKIGMPSVNVFLLASYQYFETCPRLVPEIVSPRAPFDTEDVSCSGQQ